MQHKYAPGWFNDQGIFKVSFDKTILKETFYSSISVIILTLVNGIVWPN